VELGSVGGTRIVPIDEYFISAKKSVLQAEELIHAVWVPRSDGPQAFAKVGYRNAMVIAVCSFALALHPMTRRVGTGIGSAGPVPLRAMAAQEFLEGHLDESNAWELRPPIAENVRERFASLVAGAARPIDDVRGSAGYRRHALEVLARRTLSWCWDDYRDDGSGAAR
jgi:CO/xanthine dehydrogenase FAD-binding subunit